MTELPQAEKQLLVAAERRIGWFILALIPPGSAVAYWFGDAMSALVFALGGGLAYGNYRWLSAVVDALVRAQRTRPTGWDYTKLFAPVVLLGLLLYGIFSFLPVSFVGILSGVLLLVPAVFLEALVQIVLGARN